MAQVTLKFGDRVVWEAVDPNTGAPVAGVVVRNAVLSGLNLTPPDPSTDTDLGAVPLLTPVDLDEQAEA